MIVRKYDSLPEEAKRIREEVFVEEQGFEEEFDTIDREAIHLVIFEEDKAVATCRAFLGKEEGEYVIGRLAVRKEYRGQAYGREIVRAGEEEIRILGGRRVRLAAQTRARGFYEKCGYSVQGEEFMDAVCPHIWMVKGLG